jgi:hypothetical protein
MRTVPEELLQLIEQISREKLKEWIERTEYEAKVFRIKKKGQLFDKEPELQSNIEN